MGGFGLRYQEGSEQAITALASPPGFGQQIDFYRIDDTRMLCLSWRLTETDTWLFVIDHSDPVTVTFGAAVNFNDDVMSDRPTVTQLTDTDWLLIDGVHNYKRFTIVGDTITPGDLLPGNQSFDYADWNGVAGWNSALWEGHDADSPLIEVTVTGFGGALQCLGIDVDHILVPGWLTWTTGGTPPREHKWYVLDLSTDGVQPVAMFDAASGYYPNPNGAAQVAPGVGYWWTWDTWAAGSDPTGLELVRVETDGSSITTAQVTGVAWGTVLGSPSDPGRLGLGPDDTWWMELFTDALGTVWTPGSPYLSRVTMARVDDVTATSHEYVGEHDLGAWTSGVQTAWLLDAATGRMVDGAGHTWQVDDEHLRAEDQTPFRYRREAGHVFFGAPLAGLSHGRAVFVNLDNATVTTFYAAVHVEDPLPPTPDFDVTPGFATAGDVVTFDAAEAPSYYTLGQTRDSYWHPVLEYRWEWDDGSADTFTTSSATTHIYHRPSTTHVAGTGTADADERTGLAGEIGYYLPLLRARNSVGWSYAWGAFLFEVDGPPPPQRQFPRDDGLGISTRRSWPPPTSKQYSQRRGPNATYQ